MNDNAVRAAMVPITRGMRAYFAPIDRQTRGPAIFDPGQHGAFLLDAPPAPWIDLGWIDSFQRSCGTKVEVMRAGVQGLSVGQYRGQIDVHVEFEFREWGKLQMALASGSEHMNVLASEPYGDAMPSGGTPTAAVGTMPSSTAREIVLGPGVVDAFDIGDIVAVDCDYVQQTGYVGSGIAAAFVKDPADVRGDKDYIRRITFNLGRVAQKTTNSLLLAQALPGGDPPASAGIQKVVAFLDREGGSFFQEWSALFIAAEDSGGRICFYYPRLGPATGRNANGIENKRETINEIDKPIMSVKLHASFVAFGRTDENDGQTVVCYRSYFPAPKAAIY